MGSQNISFVAVFDSVIDFIEKLSDGVSILLVNWIM